MLIEGYKHQIASMLGINEGTSKSQLSHARKMLQGQINKLKITVMEPNKLEKQFKEQLNSRKFSLQKWLELNWMQCLTRVMRTGEAKPKLNSLGCMLQQVCRVSIARNSVFQSKQQ
jgi:hypothetical protein